MTVDGMTWMNPPAKARTDSAALHLVTGANGDFWRPTHYGFIHDSGHFLHHDAPGDFSAEVTVEAGYEAQFNQAGQMLWQDPEHWLKCGIEYADRRMLLSVVATNGSSDWSVRPGRPGPLHLRLTRQAEALRVEAMEDGGFALIRLAWLPPGPARVGVMACSPSRAGLAVTFRDYDFGPPAAGALHPED
jgi:regulation of enolase protein 1 (concanavalin A-like superfamily)